MVDIAAEAGVGVGTIYNYFADKQAVFEAIFEARAEEFQSLIDQAVEGKSPCAQIEALIRSSIAYLDEHGALVAMFHERGAIGELDIERLGGEVMEQGYQRFLRQLEDAIAAAIASGELRKDIPAAAMVAALAGARNGAIYMWLKSKRREQLSLLADQVLALFFRGARLQS